MDYALVVAIALLIVGAAGTYFQSQQVKMMKTQMPSVTEVDLLSLSIRRSRWTMAILATLVVAAWAPYFMEKKPGPEWDSQPLTPIRDKHFAAQTVKLDGYEYINCTFDDVTFEFQGRAPSRLEGSRIKGTGRGNRIVALRTDNAVVAHTMILLNILNNTTGLKEGPSVRVDEPLP